MAEDGISPAENKFLRHQPMRAPREHGEVLQVPPSNQWESTWNQNLQIDRCGNHFQFTPLPELISKGRAEIVTAAAAYSGAYRNADLANRNAEKILMAGHQPALFHPGVWYKHFVLSRLAEKFNCIAINLVVDTDICNSTSITVPKGTGETFSLEAIPYDASGQILPFEERQVLDRKVFESFGKRAADAIRPLVNTPIVEHLWPAVLANDQQQNIGSSIAGGRHAIEAEYGLQTLELPISRLATLNVFALFAQEILFRIESFLPIYNEVVEAYRKLHKIRSRSHPAPNLQIDDGWHETPFWIWHADRPRRRSLYARISKNTLRISDRDQVDYRLGRESLVEQFQELSVSGVRIRPKALMTTMFGRLIASDMFIHGIGGAKYDQLTDEIALRFFETVLPQHLTVTATIHIANPVPVITKQQINKLRDRQRQLAYHPESFVDNENDRVKQLVDAKREWIELQLPVGTRLKRHRGIKECNSELLNFALGTKADLLQQEEQMRNQLHASRIINSREFSFCIFGKELPELLSRMS